MSIKTDSTPLGEPMEVDNCNVFALYSLFATDEEKQALAADYRAGAIGYGEAKKRLVTKIDDFFRSAREKQKELQQNPDTVEEILRDGAQRARAEAQKTMDMVRSAVGLR